MRIGGEGRRRTSVRAVGKIDGEPTKARSRFPLMNFEPASFFVPYIPETLIT